MCRVIDVDVACHRVHYHGNLRAGRLSCRYFRKGAANICGFVELINEAYTPGDGQGNDENPSATRLVPRTEDLPLYTVAEFNDKVRAGKGRLCARCLNFVGDTV